MLVEKSVIGGHCCQDWMEVREVTQGAIEQVAARLFERKLCSSATHQTTFHCFQNPLCNKAKKNALTRRSYSPYFIFSPWVSGIWRMFNTFLPRRKKKKEKSQKRKQNIFGWKEMLAVMATV